MQRNNIFAKWKLDIYITDEIFLYLDFETLQKTRILQSKYVKNVTAYSDISIAASHGNLANMKWLLENDYIFDEYEFRKAFSNAAEHGNLANMNWLLENGCPLYV